MISVLDYDAGNLKSVEKALIKCEVPAGEIAVTRDRDTILSSDHVILPGVGAFGDAMKKLEGYRLIPVIEEAVAKEIPFLGICLGMQLLFDSSEEAPGVSGLSLLPGKIRRIPPRPDLKIPHMGWNALHFDHPGRLFEGLPEGTYVYFVHSYYLEAEDPEIVKASTQYGTTIHASVEKGRLFGCQFHPEKSSACGLKMLQNFLLI